jgi:hypothetical protein
MRTYPLKRLKVIFLTLIFTAMVIPAFSQDTPDFDKIPTSAGVVQLYFI